MEKKRENLNKKGQVTLFIIIAIGIVAAGALIYIFYPQISSVFGGEVESPQAFLETCLEDEVSGVVDKISAQGGSMRPEHYFVYNNSNVEYLCYAGGYYEKCAMQQPMLKKHVEKEIGREISAGVKKCFEDMEKSFEKKGYRVNLQQGSFNVEFLPKRIVIRSESKLSLTKDETKTYDSFEIGLRNNLYELISITNSILNMEATYGDAETTTYMNYYHDLQVEKKKQTDGTTIYILTNRNNGKKFQFASRSIAWPPGYGVNEV